MRWWALLGLSGCMSLGAPQTEDLGPGPAAVRLAWTPAEFVAEADYAGGLERFAVTSTAVEIEEVEELALTDEADEELTEGLTSVAPILAMTGTVSFDLPQSDDPRVAQWVEYLSGRGRVWYTRWLARSTRYVPIFWDILDQYGLPRDLVFLSMIESGFSPKAYSWAHAAGAWQFMPNTGRAYGLEVGFWVDERRDFEKSTHAAARHLRDLYEAFGDWHLAFAAYNAGSGKVRRAIRGSGSKDFWRISKTWWLRRETRHYVPKLLAAGIVSKQPDKFGFSSVEYLPPLTWDVVTVTVAVDLESVARACGTDLEHMKLLNPALRLGVTPPGRAWPLRIPPDAGPGCVEGIRSSPLTFRYHEVFPGDTLPLLAKKYQTSTAAIARFNEMTGDQVQDFEELAVPVPLAVAATIAVVEPDPFRFRGGSYGPDGGQVVVHRVGPGDSLWKIARRYRVSVKKLKLWNGLWRNAGLRQGQAVRIHLGKGGAPEAQAQVQPAQPAKLATSRRHRVRAGESLWSIAERYGTTVEALRKANRISRGAKLQVGQALVIR